MSADGMKISVSEAWEQAENYEKRIKALKEQHAKDIEELHAFIKQIRTSYEKDLKEKDFRIFQLTKDLEKLQKLLVIKELERYDI